MSLTGFRTVYINIIVYMYLYLDARAQVFSAI